MKKGMTKIISILFIVVIIIIGMIFRIHQVNKGISNSERHKQVKLYEYFDQNDVAVKVNTLEVVDIDEGNNKQIKMTLDLKKIKDLKGKYNKSYFSDCLSMTQLYIVNKNGTLSDKIVPEENLHKENPNIVEIMNRKRVPGKEIEKLVLRYTVSSKVLDDFKNNKLSIKLGFQKDSQATQFNYIDITAKDLNI